MKDQNIEHAGMVSLRCDFPDIYGDLLKIIQAVVQIWGRELIDEHYQGSFDVVVEGISSGSLSKPQHSNRIYMTTEFFWPCLVAADLSKETMEAIKSNADNHDGIFGPPSEEIVRLGRDCFVVWLFSGEAIEAVLPITSTMASEMLSAFSPENLISLNRIRPHWDLPRL